MNSRPIWTKSHNDEKILPQTELSLTKEEELDKSWNPPGTWLSTLIHTDGTHIRAKGSITKPSDNLSYNCQKSFLMLYHGKKSIPGWTLKLIQ